MFSFFKKAVAPSVPKPVVEPLPKITAPPADVCKKFNPTPQSQALLKPNQSAGEYVGALEQNQMSGDAINTLAHGMPERESVWWACESSKKVAGQMQPSDQAAMQAAEAWVKNPTPDMQAQAAAAAAKTDYQGPGAWAAQGAAWAQPQPTVAAPGVTPPAGLTGKAVAGSVMLSSAMAGGAYKPAPVNIPQTPVPENPTLPQMVAPELQQPQLSAPEQAQAYKTHQPFIQLGKDVAAGRNTWA
jgi:hypothetical protein